MPLIAPLRRPRSNYWNPMSVPGDAQRTLPNARRKGRSKADTWAIQQGHNIYAEESPRNVANSVRTGGRKRLKRGDLVFNVAKRETTIQERYSKFRNSKPRRR